MESDEERSPRDKRTLGAGAGVAIGAGIGAALFAATGSPVWIAVGVAIGAAMGVAGASGSTKKDDDDPE